MPTKCTSLYVLFAIWEFELAFVDQTTLSKMGGEIWWLFVVLNTLRRRQNCRHSVDDIFRCIVFNGNCCISINLSPKFVPKGQVNDISASVQIMAWCRPGDKPLSETVMVSLLTHICVSRPQWVKMLNGQHRQIVYHPAGNGLGRMLDYHQ